MEQAGPILRPFIMNRVPANIITMLQQDTPELLPIHFEFLKTWHIWENLMQCYTVGQALDLTYIYNRECMTTMVGINLDWSYVMEVNSLGLALFLCDLGKPPQNTTEFMQTAFNRGFPWLVCVLMRRFPRPFTLSLDLGWSRFYPVPMEGRVENCLAVIKAWSTKQYDRSIWNLLVPRHFIVNSLTSWCAVLEIPNIPFDLFWEHRKVGTSYLTQQSITYILRAKMDDELRWTILTSEPGLGACIVLCFEIVFKTNGRNINLVWSVG
jgi:hypothetical protein